MAAGDADMTLKGIARVVMVLVTVRGITCVDRSGLAELTQR